MILIDDVLFYKIREQYCNMLGVPYPVQFTRAPLVGSLDMDYWCSSYETKGARVNSTGYGTPNMF